MCLRLFGLQQLLRPADQHSRVDDQPNLPTFCGSQVIVAVGKRWVVIQATPEGGYFDGYSAFRLEDLKRVRFLEDFGREFARTLPTWPPRCPDGLELDSTESFIRSMAAQSNLVGIEEERRRSGLWIGQVEKVTSKWTWLLEVRPDASWHSAPLGYKNKRITLVSINSMYQQALATIAVPSAQSPSN